MSADADVSIRRVPASDTSNRLLRPVPLHPSPHPSGGGREASVQDDEGRLLLQM